MRPARLLAPLAAAILAACATTPAPMVPVGTPSTAADLKGATVLDVDRYRPTLPLAACAPKPFRTATPSAPLAPALAAAQQYSDRMDGLGLMVLKDGQLVHAQFAAGVDARTPTATASMMKSVLGMLVGIAIDRGLIASVDDPVGRYLREWSDDPRGGITIRQLLTMASGLGPSDFQRILLAPDIGAAALETPLAGPPGRTFAYNNAVSQLLAMVIDRQARAKGEGGLAPLLHKSIWCPLGNAEATLWVDATGHPRGYAGLHAGLEDWARLGELVRNRGKAAGRQLVPKDWIATMATPWASNPQYGYQLWLGPAGSWTPKRAYAPGNPILIPHAEPFAAPDIVYFDGFGGQRVYVIPSLGLTIARVGRVNLGYDDAIIPNLLIRALQ